jgi:hypothetical protein
MAQLCMTAEPASPSKATAIVRAYRPDDRQAVRDLCCDTGFLGKPIDPVFEDRELFADFLTAHYTDHEPENGFILEHDGSVKGYLISSRMWGLRATMVSLPASAKSALKLLFRVPGYNRASRDYVRWLLLEGWRQTPPAPRESAHFHVNLLPEVRGAANSLRLFNAFFNHLIECGEKQVYGQMATYDDRRTERVFQRLGFEVLNRCEITKYRKWLDKPVYLSTIYRDLSDAKKDGMAMS